MLQKIYFSVDIEDLPKVLQILGSFQRQTFKDTFYDQDFILLKNKIFLRKRHEKWTMMKETSKLDDVISYSMMEGDLDDIKNSTSLQLDQDWEEYEIVTTRTTFDVYPDIVLDICHFDDKTDFYYVFSTTIAKEFLHSILANVEISFHCNPKFLEYLLKKDHQFLKQKYSPTKFHVDSMQSIFPLPDCYALKFKTQTNMVDFQKWMEILREASSDESGSESDRDC